MKKALAILMLRLICFASLWFGSIGIAIAQPPVVSVYGQHYGGKVLYIYRLVNNGPYEISSVWIGYDSLNDNNPDTEVWELNELPSGLTEDLKIPPASVTSPLGWEAILINPEETPTHIIDWGVANDSTPRLPVGLTLSGMSITLDKIDISHVTSHATIHFSNRPSTDDVTVPMQRLDTTPPTLSVTLSPVTLWPPSDKLVPITATVTVKDDYDPSPEIKLESITANEVLDKDDIKDAQLGTDDRSFKLRAERDGKDSDHKKQDRTDKHLGRIYTVTYSATDASGNKTTASATVTVPHDRDDKEQQKSHDGKDNKKDGGVELIPFTSQK
jgi:hypothetical protein